MKNTMKYLIATVLLLTSFSTSTMASVTTQDLSHAEVNRIVGRLTEVHDKSIRILSQKIENFHDVYGGSYFDENFELVINRELQ